MAVSSGARLALQPALVCFMWPSLHSWIERGARATQIGSVALTNLTKTLKTLLL